MQILMLGWELPPHNSGGMGVVCYELSKSLVDQGAVISFVVPYRAKHDIDWMEVHSALDLDAKTFRLGAGVYASPQSLRLSTPIIHFDHLVAQTEAYAQAVAHQLDKYSFEIIHVHDWLAMRAGILAKQLSGKPLIVHLHATQFDQAGGKFGNPIVHEIEYMGLSIADRIVTVSQFTKDTIVREYGIDPGKVDVVHNQINGSSFCESDQHNPYQALGQLKQAGWQVVSYLGRITIQKGLANFLRAFVQVVDRRPKTILLLAGSGEQIRELQILAAELGIAGNLAFTNGFVNGNKMNWACKIADLFVMPSASEPFGLTPLEAILQGAPTLISKQSGVSELLQNTLKVDHWDIDGMANQVTSALASPGLLATMIVNARAEVMSMNWSKAASQIMVTYQNAKRQIETEVIS